MRTIKFKGKCCHSDAWAYGSLVDYGESEYPEIQGFDIFCEGRDDWQETIVECDTIGQFTGLYDKNGKEIYEGDILKVYYYGKSKVFGVVMFGESRFFINDNFPKFYNIKVPMSDIFKKYDFEVIGNIHDNPELLKQEVKDE